MGKKLINGYQLSLKVKLEKKIYSYIKTLWLNKVDSTIFTEWKENFKGISEDELTNMIYLLSKFSYLGEKEIRLLLKTMFRDLFKYPIVEKIRESNSDTQNIEFINDEFQNELGSTRFIGVGNPSESGVHLLYYFRQENNLSKEFFINNGDIFLNTPKEETLSTREIRSYLESSLKDDKIKRYVFIDDFCGSGNQVCTYLKPIIEGIKYIDSSIEVNYLMLIGLEEGIKKVKDMNLFNNVEAIFSIDQSFKCFSVDSRYFLNVPDKIIQKELAKSISIKYGTKLFSNALGYSCCELIIGLFHNTPDNSLPIFWSDENWYPIFKRYNKLY